jgi:hypothetical protein
VVGRGLKIREPDEALSATSRKRIGIFISSAGRRSRPTGLALAVVDRLQYDPALLEHVVLALVAVGMPGEGAPTFAEP